MRNFKRFLALALAMLMVVGAMFSVAAFEDVTDYSKAITVLSDIGIIMGYTEDEFGPDDDVERWQMALLISKMMKGDVNTATWEGENFTTFQDIEEQHYYGSISYANKMGVVKGTSNITFEPEAGISYQDALTMAVRALGYSSSTMDAGYPWTYIDKAGKLGLEKDLTDIAYTDTLTRGETAQLLYNAFNAAKADGGSFATDVFNLTDVTVVITGSRKLNMLGKDAAVTKADQVKDGNQYVAFNKLNANGSMDSTTYHLPCTSFGIENNDNAISDAVGSSYKVVTTTEFKNLDFVSVTPCDSVVVDATNFIATDSVVTIDDVDYDVVKNLTVLNNTQGHKGTNPEIIVYSVNGDYTIGQVSQPRVDKDGNFLNNDNVVVLKAVYSDGTNVPKAGNYILYYLAKTSVGTDAAFNLRVDVRNADGSLKDLSVYGVKYDNVIGTGTTYNAFSVFEKASAIKGINAYAEVALYDDNGDGTYDRAMYENYKFAQYTQNKDDANRIKIANNEKPADVAVVDETEEAKVEINDYVLYTYNAQSKTLTFKEELTPIDGIVKEINRIAKTMRINDTVYNIGDQFLLGAISSDAGEINKMEQVTNNMFGRYAKVVIKDNKILSINDYNTAATPFTVDSVAGYQTNGNINILGYAGSEIAKVVTVATIDGLPYSTWIYNPSMNNINNDYLNNGKVVKGATFTATVDSAGNYHLKTLSPSEYQYYVKDKTGTAIDNSVSATITFVNGVAYAASTDNFCTYTGASIPFSKFSTNANTVFVVNDNGTMKTSRGVPANNAAIELYDESKIYIQWDNNDTKVLAKYVYIYDGALTNNFITSANDTVVYIDKDCQPTIITDSSVSGNIYGSAWNLNNVVDMKTGLLTTVKYNLNINFEVGKFYNVRNGYVINEARVGNEADVVTSRITHIDSNFDFTIVDNSGKEKAVTNKAISLYQFNSVGRDVINTDGTNNINPKNYLYDAAFVKAINDSPVGYAVTYAKSFADGNQTGSIVLLVGDKFNSTNYTVEAKNSTYSDNDQSPLQANNTNYVLLTKTNGGTAFSIYNSIANATTNSFKVYDETNKRYVTSEVTGSYTNKGSNYFLTIKNNSDKNIDGTNLYTISWVNDFNTYSVTGVTLNLLAKSGTPINPTPVVPGTADQITAVQGAVGEATIFTDTSVTEFKDKTLLVYTDSTYTTLMSNVTAEPGSLVVINKGIEILKDTILYIKATINNIVTYHSYKVTLAIPGVKAPELETLLAKNILATNTDAKLETTLSTIKGAEVVGIVTATVDAASSNGTWTSYAIAKATAAATGATIFDFSDKIAVFGVNDYRVTFTCDKYNASTSVKFTVVDSGVTPPTPPTTELPTDVSGVEVAMSLDVYKNTVIKLMNTATEAATGYTITDVKYASGISLKGVFKKIGESAADTFGKNTGAIDTFANSALSVGTYTVEFAKAGIIGSTTVYATSFTVGSAPTVTVVYTEGIITNSKAIITATIADGYKWKTAAVTEVSLFGEAMINDNDNVLTFTALDNGLLTAGTYNIIGTVEKDGVIYGVSKTHKVIPTVRADKEYVDVENKEITLPMFYVNSDSLEDWTLKFAVKDINRGTATDTDLSDEDLDEFITAVTAAVAEVGPISLDGVEVKNDTVEARSFDVTLLTGDKYNGVTGTLVLTFAKTGEAPITLNLSITLAGLEDLTA